MATLLNDRNQLLFASSSRVTGASVSIVANPVLPSLIILKNGPLANSIIPGIFSLVVNTTGYIQPSFSWSYALVENADYGYYTANNLDPLTPVGQEISGNPKFMVTSADATQGGSFPVTNPLTVNFQTPDTFTYPDWWINSTATHLVFKVIVTELASNVGINQAQATVLVPFIREGQNGASLNTAIVTIFRRSPLNEPPEMDIVGSSTYNFTNGTVVGIPPGWSPIIPQAIFGTYIWSAQTVVASPATQVTFENLNFQSPVLYSANGTPGRTSAIILAYTFSDIVPQAFPSANVRHNFRTNQTLGGFENPFNTGSIDFGNGWSSQPTLSTIGTDYSVYMSTNVVFATEDPDELVYADPLTWSSPIRLGRDGKQGLGISTAIVSLYSRNDDAFNAPFVDRLTSGGVNSDITTYDFATGVLSGEFIQNNFPTWRQDPVNVGGFGDSLWAISTTVRGNTTSDSTTSSFSNITWGQPYKVSRNGIDGINGSDGIRGSRSIYDNSPSYNNSYNAGIVGITTSQAYAVRATELIAYYVGNAIPTTPIQGDTVTFTNGTDYVYTVTYNSDTDLWEPPGTVIDGNLLVTGSVTASKIDTRGLQIRDLAGNVIFGVGVPITEQHLSNGLIDTLKGRSNLSYSLSSAWDLSPAPYYDAQYNTYYGGAELTILSGTPTGTFPNILGPRAVPEKVTYVKSVAGDGFNNEGWSKGLMQRSFSGINGYRFMLPVYKYSGGTTGNINWGMVFNQNGLDTIINFMSIPASSLTMGRWYLLIGFFGPSNALNYPTQSMSETPVPINGSIYDTFTTQFTNLPSGQSGRILDDSSTLYEQTLGHSAQYVSGAGEFFIAAPFIHMLNGSEPSIQECLSSGLSEDIAVDATLAAANASAAADAASTASQSALIAANNASNSAQIAGEQALQASIAANAVSASKLNKTGSDILSATISIDAATGAGFRASPSGDVLQWNASGVRTSGRGVAMTPGGIIGHNGAKTTFAISASTGNAVFSGDLQVVGSGQGLAKTEITNNVIKVYDSAGVLRVKIGDLNA